ncbi:MAG: hypothetical protein OEW88_00695 [Gammaproteobacteria bacterium]|nr:hypothetical protein [Gammaproteobacteria bacterium]
MPISPSTAILALSVAWLALTGAGLAADAPPRPASPARLPASIQADLRSIADQCTEVGGKPLTGDAVKRADLNGDGREDFVLDTGSVNCNGAASVYGDREKWVGVYVGDGKGGATSAFSDSVFGAAIDTTGPAPRLWLTVSGEQCGKGPAKDFASENFCDRAIVWNAATKKFDYGPVSSVRMIE